MRKRKRRLWHETPWDGQPGFFAAWRRFFYQFEGTSQLGDPNEPPYVPPENPRCPVCSELMRDHRIERGGPGKPTHLRCPQRGAGSGSGSESASEPEPEPLEA